LDTLAAQVEVGGMYHKFVLREGNLDRNFLKGYEKAFLPGRLFDSHDLEPLFLGILDNAQDLGFPFASIRLDSIARHENMIGAAMDFDSGPFITFDTVNVTGTSKIQPLYLSRLL